MSELIYFCEDVPAGHNIQKCEVVYRVNTGRTGFDADLQGDELLGHILDGAFAWDFGVNALKQYSKLSGSALVFFSGTRHASKPVHRVVTYLNLNPSHEVVCDEVPFVEDEKAYLDAIQRYLLSGGYVVQWFPDFSATVYGLHGTHPIVAWCSHCKEIGVTTREVRSRDDLPIW